MRRFPRPRKRQDHVLPFARYRRRGRVRPLLAGVAAFTAVFAGGMLVTAGKPVANDAVEAAAAGLSEVVVGEAFPCTVASVTDGDTLRCHESDGRGRAIRVRLSGVAARERDGSCSPGHPCPNASAGAATAELEALALGQELSCRNVGETYGRIAAFCSRADGVDLSCAMVASGTALKWDRYWGWHRCPG